MYDCSYTIYIYFLVLQSWHDGITKAKHIYTRLKQGNHWDEYSFKSYGIDSLGVKKSPISSSIGSKVPSSNNSVSGSVELNESKNVSMDHDKTNSISSDEGSGFDLSTKSRSPQNNSSRKLLKTNTPNSLVVVQPSSNLGQSLPNLNLNSNHNSHSNTLLVPGTSSKSSSGHSNLLSPIHRGISYPPPSPPRFVSLLYCFIYFIELKFLLFLFSLVHIYL